MEKDLGFSENNHWFRIRAVALIIHDNKLLLVKNEVDPYYYTVGGGIHHNESSSEAVKREVKEEIGLDLEIERLVYIHENFFTGSFGLNGALCHQIEFYYLMKCNHLHIQKIVCDSTTTDQHKEHLYWIDISKLNEYMVYPLFLKDRINHLPHSLEHLITYE